MRDLLLRSILVASDLSPASDAAVGAAAALAGASGAALHLLHVYEPPFSTYPGGIGPAEMGIGEPVSFTRELADAEEALARQYLRAVPGGPGPASVRVRVGQVQRVVLDQAWAVGARLLVLGPHRKRMLADRLLGNTADRVVRAARIPCLVIRGALRLPLRVVTVPIDPADPAVRALDTALAWASVLGAPARDGELTGTTVRVLHLAAPIPGAGGFRLDRARVGPAFTPDVEEAVARFGAHADVEVREEVVWSAGRPREIVRDAAQEGTDLLVLGTHGRSALGRVLVGSVSSEVARSAGCPVLLIPPRLWRAPRRQRLFVAPAPGV